MLFNSYEFLVFFPIVVAAYFVIPRKVRYIWLLIASYYFYMSWNARYALLLAFSTVVTWASGYALHSVMSKTPEGGARRKKRATVAASLIANLGVLAFFKYYDFALANINVTLGVFSISPLEKPFDLLLPVGISFYTFQALSYTIDVYRGEIAAERNILKYALFVSFFPQLVAGPIERSKNLLPQIQNCDKANLWNFDRIVRGSILMLWGLFLKMVVADRAAVFVNEAYSNYWMYGSSELVLGTLLFAVQIFCDFAGYSTVATGAAKIMGFDLMENFNAPYTATSIQEFWRRWHISLSTWFRDYLYFPLGGSRCSKAKHYRNIMIVFVVSGLWHGASWNFVIWGALHGAFQVVGIATSKAKERLWSRLKVDTSAKSWGLGKALVTFLLVNFAWIFFRAETLPQSIAIVRSIFVDWNPWVFFDGSLFQMGLTEAELHVLVIAIVIMVLVDLCRRFWGKSIDAFLMEQNMWFRWVIMIMLVCAIAVFGVYGPAFVPQQFIYFQF